MDSYVARSSPLKMLKLFAAAAGFVVLGAWIAGLFGEAPQPGMEFWGWLSILFFGACGIAMLPSLLTTGDAIRISAQGIYFKRWSDATIPWSEITRVSRFSVEGQDMIILNLKDPSRFPSTGLLGKLNPANRALSSGDITIPLAGTTGNFDEAMAAIDHFRAKAR
jgi:hypothetical protein